MMSDFRGGGGQAKSGQNGTRRVGRRTKIGRPIFQEILPLFSLIFLFFPVSYILFQCDFFINISFC